MIVILSNTEIQKMRKAGKVAAETLEYIGTQIKPGISTLDIDKLVYEDTIKRGALPSQLGYHGFPASVCTSLNEVVCHGIPSDKEILKEGDIINVDITSNLEGYHGDTSRTFCVGEISSDKKLVTETSEKSLYIGIEEIKPGNRFGDIGFAIHNFVLSMGCDVVKEFGGHGIGSEMHMDPFVHHYGERGMGTRLKVGMCFSVEPMVTLFASNEICLCEDGWRVETKDKTPTAQFEHTILVTEIGYEILTKI